MTDSDSLYEYRLEQAMSMLDDAQKMKKKGVSPRSIVNRAYYGMFYYGAGPVHQDGHYR